MNFDDEINEIITTDNESVNKVLRNYAKSLLGGNDVERFNHWKKIKDDITNINILDENKHQYMSCLAGQANGFMPYVGLAAGLVKEANDFLKKSFDEIERNKYGGVKEIVNDGIKDMNNNLKGWSAGFFDENYNCKDLLRKKI